MKIQLVGGDEQELKVLDLLVIEKREDKEKICFTHDYEKKLNVSTSFDPKTYICRACTSPHIVTGRSGTGPVHNAGGPKHSAGDTNKWRRQICGNYQSGGCLSQRADTGP